MTEVTVLEIGRQAVLTAIIVAAPPLGLALVIGVGISLFQAATQIQEITLTFVPKILGVFVGLALFGPWMMQGLMNFTARMLINFPQMFK
jgi:flagellar biosynthetic protein FliQ